MNKKTKEELLAEESRIEAALDELSDEENVPWGVYLQWRKLLEAVQNELKEKENE